jgi:hypothetical protein
MRTRIQPWQLAAAVIVLCAGVVVFAHWRSTSRRFDATALIECLPPDQATHMYLDFTALRSSGILDLLAGSKTAEEPDYRHFVEQTGFDYRTDLDAVAAAFWHGGSYFTVRGRFEWKKLTEYARAQGGSCRNAICTMPGSTPERHISFYPLRSDVLALAVSAEERGTDMIGPNQWKTPPQLPPEPVWISAPSFVFSDVKNMPEGTHAFFSPLAQAQRVIFAIGPEAQRLQIRVEIFCADAPSAADVANRLTATTDLLRKMLARDRITPTARDLTAVLVGGRFQQQDKRVTGTWPVERAFVEALATGQVQ